MKKTNLKEIKLSDLTPGELMGEAKKARVEIVKALPEVKAGREKNVRKVFNLRKRLSRVLTELNKKAIIRS